MLSSKKKSILCNAFKKISNVQKVVFLVFNLKIFKVHKRIIIFRARLQYMYTCI